MTTNIYGDNPFAPGVVHDAYIPDQLIAGQAPPLVTQPILLNTGTLQRGTVLGALSPQAIEAVATVGNTGNGVISGLTRGAGSMEGAYVLTAKTATDFGVVDPEGNVLPDLTTGVAYAQQGLNLTLTAGGVAFVAGDSFTLNSYDATGQYKISVATASDGSQIPSAVLVDYADASGGVITAGAYIQGAFNARSLIYDPSWTLATLRAAMRAFSLIVKNPVSAADPSNI